jgi:hypothetical protein
MVLMLVVMVMMVLLSMIALLPDLRPPYALIRFRGIDCSGFQSSLDCTIGIGQH